MNLKIVTAPTQDPVSVAELKTSARIIINDDDEDIRESIEEARIVGENITGRAFVTQIWDLTMDGFPEVIYVPKPPLVSITHIKYIDTQGTLVTLSAALYQLSIRQNDPARISPAYQTSWPQTLSVLDAVQVRFVCGYGAPADVPAPIKGWIKTRVRTMYECREAIVLGQTIDRAPREFVDGRLDEYMVYR